MTEKMTRNYQVKNRPTNFGGSPTLGGSREKNMRILSTKSFEKYISIK